MSDRATVFALLLALAAGGLVMAGILIDRTREPGGQAQAPRPPTTAALTPAAYPPTPMVTGASPAPAAAGPGTPTIPGDFRSPPTTDFRAFLATTVAGLTPFPTSTPAPTPTPDPCGFPERPSGSTTRFAFPDGSMSFEYPANFAVLLQYPRPGDPIPSNLRPAVFIRNTRPECVPPGGVTLGGALQPPWFWLTAGAEHVQPGAPDYSASRLQPEILADGTRNPDILERQPITMGGLPGFLTRYRDAIRTDYDQLQALVSIGNDHYRLGTIVFSPEYTDWFHQVIDSVVITR